MRTVVSRQLTNGIIKITRMHSSSPYEMNGGAARMFDEEEDWEEEEGEEEWEEEEW